MFWRFLVRERAESEGKRDRQAWAKEAAGVNGNRKNIIVSLLETSEAVGHIFSRRSGLEFSVETNFEEKEYICCKKVFLVRWIKNISQLTWRWPSGPRQTPSSPSRTRWVRMAYQYSRYFWSFVVKLGTDATKLFLSFLRQEILPNLGAQ